jgi:hypothetical protein
MNVKSLISSSAVFTVIMMVSIFNVAKASEKVVATVSSDDNTKTSYQLVIDSKNGRGIEHFYKDVYEDGKKTRRTELDPKVLMDTGMILEQRDKYVVMKLKSDNFDLEQGGIVVVDTLYSGVSGERKTYEIQLAQDKSGWALFKAGKTIKEIQIKTNRVMVIGAVGIKTLVMK